MNKKDKQKAKQDRLAQALRENLKRRKQSPLTPHKTNSATDESTPLKKE